jgi:outer membrane receptor protein involved in Fe transport
VGNTTAVSQGMAINVLDAFNGGGSPCCPTSTHQNQIDFQDYPPGPTRGTFGRDQFEYDNNSNLSENNFNGTYTFSSLNQYEAVINGAHVDPGDPTSPLVRATQFTVNQGNPETRYSQYETSLFLQDDYRVRQSLTISAGLRYEIQSHSDKQRCPAFRDCPSPFKDRKTTSGPAAESSSHVSTAISTRTRCATWRDSAEHHHSKSSLSRPVHR